jgi:hypothetical protein
MKAWLLRTLLPLAACLPLIVQADPPPSSRAAQEDPFAQPATQRSSARPSDEAIRAAVRATLDEMPDNPTPATGTALSGGPYREFARQFSQAEKPHCLGPDPLKHQPHSITTKNWVFGVGGIFALPFWGAAIVRGKCNWTR